MYSRMWCIHGTMKCGRWKSSSGLSVAISAMPYDTSNGKNFGQIGGKKDEMWRAGLTNGRREGKTTTQSRIYGNNIDERFHIVLICIHVANSSMAEDNVCKCAAYVRVRVYMKRISRLGTHFPCGKSQFAKCHNQTHTKRTRRAWFWSRNGFCSTAKF